MNQKAEITDLTVCRAFFAAWVFAYHINLHTQFAAGPFGGLVRHGYLGVDSFFMLSGLILARIHPELSTSAAGAFRFWGKRLARIYPVHLATILILVGLLAFGKSLGMTPQDPTRFSVTALIENLLLIHGWGISDFQAWNYPSWSVSTEWAGYLIFPGFMLFLGLMPDMVLGQVAVVMFPLLALMSARSGYALNLTFHDVLVRFFLEFTVGVCSARVVSALADELPTGIIAMIGLAWAILWACLGKDMTTLIGVFVLIYSFMMRADAERQPFFRLPWLRAFGLISYSFYMSFGIVEMCLSQVFLHLGWTAADHGLIYAAAMTLFTLLLAILLHVLVEKPVRRLVDNRINALPPLPVVVKKEKGNPMRKRK